MSSNSFPNTSGILLESGTNEFEIIEFAIGTMSYAINVAKVREVINPLPVTSVAGVHPSIEGLFTLRGKVIPLVDLAEILGFTGSTETYNIIVGELNNFTVGFKVDSVVRIHRISWQQLEPPPPLAGSSLTVGVIKLLDKLLLLLDFETIVAEINPDLKQSLQELPASTTDLIAARQKKTMLVAEDSPLLREMINSTLQQAGYTNIRIFANGYATWEYLDQLKQTNDLPDLVITDIEMPHMDGHHLLKKMKEDHQLRTIPVVIFSSLINEAMYRKGEQLGAVAQITKPQIASLIIRIDQLIIGDSQNNAQ